MQPHTSYLVCGTPRSASSLLCEALKNTSIAGVPEEYYWHGGKPFDSESGGPLSYADYLASTITQGTTPNGVFGAKVMWGYFDDFISNLRTIPEYKEIASILDLLSTTFPNLHYIWITRRDKVRQAISHWKAIQTQVWAWSTQEQPLPAKEPTFDFEAIDHLVQENIEHEAAWRRYFETSDVQPFTVVYEDLVSSYEATALQALRYLNIACPEKLAFAERRLKRQGDALSEEWVRRYLQLKHAQKEQKFR